MIPKSRLTSDLAVPAKAGTHPEMPPQPLLFSPSPPGSTRGSKKPSAHAAAHSGWTPACAGVAIVMEKVRLIPKSRFTSDLAVPAKAGTHPEMLPRPLLFSSSPRARPGGPEPPSAHAAAHSGWTPAFAGVAIGTGESAVDTQKPPRIRSRCPGESRDPSWDAAPAAIVQFVTPGSTRGS